MEIFENSLVHLLNMQINVLVFYLNYSILCNFTLLYVKSCETAVGFASHLLVLLPMLLAKPKIASFQNMIQCHQ